MTSPNPSYQQPDQPLIPLISLKNWDQWANIRAELRRGKDLGYPQAEISPLIVMTLPLEELGAQSTRQSPTVDLSDAGATSRVVLVVPMGEIWRIREIYVSPSVTATLVYIALAADAPAGGWVAGSLFTRTNILIPLALASVSTGYLLPSSGLIGAQPAVSNLSGLFYPGDSIHMQSNGQALDTAIDVRILYDRIVWQQS
jgi:hypothetical protein